jgi:hypothetical protein
VFVYYEPVRAFLHPDQSPALIHNIAPPVLVFHLGVHRCRTPGVISSSVDNSIVIHRSFDSLFVRHHPAHGIFIGLPSCEFQPARVVKKGVVGRFVVVFRGLGIFRVAQASMICCISARSGTPATASALDEFLPAVF